MDKKYYVVIDTNVVVSSLLKSDSLPGKVLRLCLDGVIKPILNDEIVAEYIDVLTRNKFDLDERIVEETINSIKEKSIYLDRTETIEEFIDKDDIVFYEVALTAGVTLTESYLVTGNKKHFPVKPFVVTPREMLEIINGEK